MGNAKLKPTFRRIIDASDPDTALASSYDLSKDYRSHVNACKRCTDAEECTYPRDNRCQEGNRLFDRVIDTVPRLSDFAHLFKISE